MPMDKEKMGKFVAQLRKEKKMTQKDLAEKLFLTDKAISKWERGLSFPDISVLEPLAEVLEVSVLELLEGERVTEELAMTKEEAERLIDHSITISDAEISRKHVVNKSIILIITLLLMLLVTIILNVWNYSKEEELRMISIDSSAYEIMEDENGKSRFVNPAAALSQLLQDITETKENPMEGE